MVEHMAMPSNLGALLYHLFRAIRIWFGGGWCGQKSIASMSRLPSFHIWVSFRQNVTGSFLPFIESRRCPDSIFPPVFIHCYTQNPKFHQISPESIHIFTWLVVYLPLWKIWVRELGLRNSQSMERHKIPWFQTTNQTIYVDLPIKNGDFP